MYLRAHIVLGNQVFIYVKNNNNNNNKKIIKKGFETVELKLHVYAESNTAIIVGYCASVRKSFYATTESLR